MAVFATFIANYISFSTVVIVILPLGFMPDYGCLIVSRKYKFLSPLRKRRVDTSCRKPHFWDYILWGYFIVFNIISFA